MDAAPVVGRSEDQGGAVRRLIGVNAGRIAWALVALTAGLVALSVIGELLAGPDALPLNYGDSIAALLAGGVVVVVTGVTGAIIVSAHPTNRLGWLYVVAAPILGVSALVFYAVAWVGVDTPAGLTAAMISNSLLGRLILLTVALAMLWFPDGRLPRPVWRAAVAIAVAGAVLRTLENLAAPFMTGYPTVLNPDVLAGPLDALLERSHDIGIGRVLEQVAVVLAALSLVDRYHGADLTLRRQIRWVVLAAAAAAALSIPLTIVTVTTGVGDMTAEWASVLFFLGFGLVPVATLIAITRYRLYAIDRIVNRTILYGSLTAILAGMFAGIVTISERIVVAISGASSDVSVALAAIVVAMTYHPIRDRIERFVDRQFRYEAGGLEAYEAQLQGVLDVVDPARALERLLHEAMAAVHTAGGAVVVQHPNGGPPRTITAGSWAPGSPSVVIPIASGRRAIGELRLAARADGHGYDEAVLDRLRTVAGLVAEGLALRT